MSLIQSALNRTQVPATPKAAPKTLVTPAPIPKNLDAIKNIQALDLEIEKKIAGRQKRPEIKEVDVKTPVSRMRVLLALLAITVLVFELQFVPFPKFSTAKTSHRAAFAPAMEVSIPVKKISDQVQALTSDTPTYVLSGIVWGGDAPYAVVNGKILLAGERVDVQTWIQGIERDRVILKTQDKVYSLLIKH